MVLSSMKAGARFLGTRLSFILGAGVLILLLAFFLAGCSSLGYYAQAIGGHVEVMLASRPISDLIADERTAPGLKEKLAEIRVIRDFASSELGLPDNGSYRSYADLRRPFVTWNVFAAPEFSLKAENWCMLVVGCVDYRGYFDRHEAELVARELRRQGFDTYIGGVPAYSTLGYFSDPVLNTFTNSGTEEAARMIFHELAHQVLYVAGDAVFNESFATAVENEGLRRWLAQGKSPDLSQMVSVKHRRRSSFVELVKSYRGRLQEIYGSRLSPNAKRAAKAKAMAEMKYTYVRLQEAQGDRPVYKDWLEKDLNNAKIASLGLYTQLLPAFEALLEAEGHDLRRFYRRVSAIGRLPYRERRQVLNRLQTVNAMLDKAQPQLVD